jgi:GTP-binding protein Era
MVHFSHDPAVGTLYCYFTELEAGQASYELEYPAALLLDSQGAPVGLRLDLDDEVTLDQLELALAHEGVALDMQTGYLRVAPVGVQVARELALEETALLDLDEEGRILGADLAVPERYRSPEALAPLAPLMVEVETSVEQQAPSADQVDTEPAPSTAPAPRQAREPLVEGQHPARLLPLDRLGNRLSKGSTQHSAPSTQHSALRSGYVALVGKPNVGKSTLLNALLGQKVAIVSPRPQTTRVPLRGILNRPDAQVVFIDTPGIHDPRHKLGAFMVELARKAIPNADVVCFMVDISTPPSRLDERIAAQVRRSRSPHILVLNKVDLKVRGENHLEQYQALGPWDMEVAVSAQSGLGLETLVDEIVRRLPPGPQLYPEDQVSDQSERQLAAELVREKVLLFTEQEVPHSVAVEVDEWMQKQNAIYMRMTINVEKESQKGIIIGAGGAMLKRIGTAARRDLEAALGQPVFVDLWVKTRPNWRDDPASLGWLGYNSKDWQ